MTWQFRTWLAWAEQIGLGELQLLPAQFWRLTLHEFDLMLAGFKRREDRAWEKIGTLGLWILAPHTKKTFTVPQLLGRGRLQTLPVRTLTDDEEAAQQEAERARVLAQALAWAESDK